MESGSIGASDAATLALLYGGGYGGGGYGRGGGIGVGYGGGGYGGHGGGVGYPGNSVLAAGVHADGTPIKTAIDCNAKIASQAIDGMSDRFEDLTRNNSFGRVIDGQTNLERRINDQNAAQIATVNDFRRDNDKNFCETQRSIAQSAKEAAACCCAAQLQACKDHAELKSLIIKENSETRELIRGDALAAANAKIIQLETINALDKHGR